MRPARRPPCRPSSGVRGGEATAGDPVPDGRIALTLGLAALGLPFGFGLPLASDFIAAIDGFAAAPDFSAAVFGRGAAAGFTVRAEAAAVIPDLAADLPGVVFVLAAVFGLAVVPDLAGVFGAASDSSLTAAVSDLVAAAMALLALFIACMAVDMVLADEVALVAAAVILLAAEVTLVAADETVRAAAGALAEALRVVLAAFVLVLAFVIGRAAARLGTLLLVDPLRTVLAGLRRAAVRGVVRAGTDLPPSRSITVVLFHERHRFTHPVTVVAREQWPQAARN